jgi:hypothetical protein
LLEISANDEVVLEVKKDISTIPKPTTPSEEANQGKSPFDNIPRVKLNITTEEIVEILRECRAGV